MNQSKALKNDALVWVVIMMVAAACAFVLLRRDSHRRFGAVSYGAFPKVDIMVDNAEEKNIHGLRTHVWTVMRAESLDAKDMLKQVYDVQRMTVSGKRFMNVLTFGNNPDVISTPANRFHYKVTTLTPLINQAFVHAGATKTSQVLLLDQDSIIRGVYDLTSPDDFRSFRQDVMRLL